MPSIVMPSIQLSTMEAPVRPASLIRSPEKFTFGARQLDRLQSFIVAPARFTSLNLDQDISVFVASTRFFVCSNLIVCSVPMVNLVIDGRSDRKRAAILPTCYRRAKRFQIGRQRTGMQGFGAGLIA